MSLPHVFGGVVLKAFIKSEIGALGKNSAQRHGEQ